MFEQSFQKVIALEGGFVLHKNQTETAQTYAGIYQKAHPHWEGWSYITKGQTPPTELVREFYRREFWEKINLDEGVKKFLLFEYGVNAGLRKAIMTAQGIVGVSTDGILGPKTKAALESIPDAQFVAVFSLARINHYLSLANRDPKRYGVYLRGWLNRTFEAIKEL